MMLTSPSGVPYFLIKAEVFQAAPPQLAPYLHKLPPDTVVGVVSPRHPRVVASLMRCFDATELARDSVSAFAEKGRVGIATGGFRVQIETKLRRLGRLRFHDVTGIEDVLIFGLERGDMNVYLDQLKDVRTVIRTHVPSITLD